MERRNYSLIVTAMAFFFSFLRKGFPLFALTLQLMMKPYNSLQATALDRQRIAKIGYSIFIYDLTRGSNKAGGKLDEAGIRLPL